MTIHYPILADGCMTRVLESGSGDANLLFIHGAGARADRWSENLEPLAAQGWHCYAMDLPGHGLAAKGGDREYSLPSLRAFLLSVIEQLGLKRYGVIGTSLGGILAADLAIQDAERVWFLSMIGSLGLEPLSREARERLAAGTNVEVEDQVRTKLRRVVYDETLVTDAWVREEFRINTSPGAHESLRAVGRAFLDDAGIGTVNLLEPLRKRVAEGLPMALFWGQQDRSVSVEIGRRAHAVLGNDVGWVEIPETAHAPYFEKPDTFNQALLRHLPRAGR